MGEKKEIIWYITHGGEGKLEDRAKVLDEPHVYEPKIGVEPGVLLGIGVKGQFQSGLLQVQYIGDLSNSEVIELQSKLGWHVFSGHGDEEYMMYALHTATMMDIKWLVQRFKDSGNDLDNISDEWLFVVLGPQLYPEKPESLSGLYWLNLHFE